MSQDKPSRESGVPAAGTTPGKINRNHKDIKKLLDLGVQRGFLSYTEVHELLPPELISAEEVDEVIMGNILSAGVGQSPARQAMRLAGVPDATGAVNLNKLCGSGMKAIRCAVDTLCLESACIDADNFREEPFTPC